MPSKATRQCSPAAETTAGKQRGKPFIRGESGNPSGRPVGARHKTTRAIEALLEGEAEGLTRKVISMGLAGDMAALRLCLERLAPARKDMSVTIDLPPIQSAADTIAASSALLSAVGSGEITPDEAGRLMALLSAHKAIVEAGDLEARIAALEVARAARR
jgi:hypothetical protein